MYHALDLGISADDFWKMSPRAVVNIQREMVKARKATIKQREQQKREQERGPRLSRIPRP